MRYPSSVSALEAVSTKLPHMVHIAQKLTDLTGNTPLLELCNFNQHHQTLATIIAKLVITP